MQAGYGAAMPQQQQQQQQLPPFGARIQEQPYSSATAGSYQSYGSTANARPAPAPAYVKHTRAITYSVTPHSKTLDEE